MGGGGRPPAGEVEGLLGGGNGNDHTAGPKAPLQIKHVQASDTASHGPQVRTLTLWTGRVEIAMHGAGRGWGKTIGGGGGKGGRHAVTLSP